MLIADDRERQRRLTHRALPIAALAAVAFAIGLAFGGLGDTGDERTARAFGEAWTRGDYAAMYKLLTPSARQAVSERAFKDAYEQAFAEATATGVDVQGPDGGEGDAVRLPVTFATKMFGKVPGEVNVPIQDDLVAWSRRLVFTGLGPNGALTRRSQPPPRGKILSREGKVLAEGPAGSRTAGAIGDSIAGEVKPPDTEAARDAQFARGFERDVATGRSGLERAFDAQLAGKPGGQLLAGGRVIARAKPTPGKDVRSTIDTKVQESAVSALGERLGGIAALEARTGQVLGLSGIAFSSPQAPGSTFKIITTTAGLEDGKVKPSDDFPVVTAAEIDGVPLENANGESCGGTFPLTFAHSCNSVFAPLGVKIGAKRLVEVSERYGFNRPPGIPGAAVSTIPPANEIKSPLEVGSTAIGQGKVLATPLMLATIAQTIAAGGVRSEPSLRLKGPPPKRTRVTSARIAKQIGAYMTLVVKEGTGTAAAIPGVTVAGKTGTAEIGGEEGDTHAWFTSYAPAQKPKVVVAVFLANAGAGGTVAAPVAREVLLSAVK